MSYKKIVIIFVVIFIIIELLVRIVLFCQGMGFFRKPRFISPWFTVYDQPPPLEKNGILTFQKGQKTTVKVLADTIRIICLGGSTTVNAATKNHYPAVLQEMLNRHYKNVKFEVLNAGGDAFSSAHSLVNLALRLTYYNPDCIIVYHNINDLSVNYFTPEVMTDYSNKYLNNLFLASECKVGMQKYLFGSRFLSFLIMKINNVNFNTVAARRSKELDISTGKEVFRNNLYNIALIAKGHKIRVIFGLQAACFKKTERFPYIKSEDFLAYNDVVRDVASEFDIPVVDAFSYLGQREQFFNDLVHYTESGVNKVSEAFFGVIIKMYPDVPKRQAKVDE